jgi:hypothetical protein
MTTSEYRLNLFRMAVMWSFSSFGLYMMNMFNKYIEGSLLMNTSLDSIATFVSVAMTTPIYTKYGVRTSFLFSFCLTLVCMELVFALESSIIDPLIVYKLGIAPKSSFIEGSEEANNYYMAYLVPMIAFFAKVGINNNFQNSYVVSFSNDTIFPVHKRAVAIGICNFVARSLTVLSFIVAELEKPKPVLYLCIITFFSLIVSLTFPNK